MTPEPTTRSPWRCPLCRRWTTDPVWRCCSACRQSVATARAAQQAARRQIGLCVQCGASLPDVDAACEACEAEATPGARCSPACGWCGACT